MALQAIECLTMPNVTGGIVDTSSQGPAPNVRVDLFEIARIKAHCRIALGLVGTNFEELEILRDSFSGDPKQRARCEMPQGTGARFDPNSKGSPPAQAGPPNQGIEAPAPGHFKG